MNWADSISRAIEYIEMNITNDLKIEDISKYAYISPYYFQRGFTMLCGYSVGEYIRNRRLSMAGYELLNTDSRIIDIAIKYGYDSPDSFTKAFTRFHSSTPTAVRKNNAAIKEFAPLKVNIVLNGGYILDYKIIKKEAFQVIGLKKSFEYEKACENIPKLYKQFFTKNIFNKIKPKYGINIDESMGNDLFDYIIGDDYNSNEKIPKDFEIINIPKFTWAVFPCIGPLSKNLKIVNEKIFRDWLPNTNNYVIAAGYNIEMYSDPKAYKNGLEDDNYYCEVWIPVSKKYNID